MAIFQIIYLVINLIGFAFGLVWLTCSPNTSIFSRFFTFVGKRLGNIGLIIAITLLIALFLPALSIMTAIIIFTVLFGTYSNS